MRAVLVSKALVNGTYQSLAEAIGQQGVDLTVLCPAYWKDSRGLQTLERKTGAHFVLEAIPMRFNGHFHVHYYPDLGRRLRALNPDLLHMDEEPYNLATWLGVRHAHRLGIGTLFATWQNLRRAYPPPFRWWERDVYGKVDHALAGTPAAKDVLRRKGYQGKVTINPQVGVDTETFAPAPAAVPRARFTIGYAGGLVPEKGVDMLLRACAQLPDPWRLQLAGTGTDAARLHQLAQRLGIAPHVRFLGRRPSGQMADFYRQVDVLALPSRTRRNWKEQFGRVLIEAMACGVPVVVSDSGEGQRVAASAGLVYPEADVNALARHLRALSASAALRRSLGEAGRARARQHFSMQAVAAKVVAAYQDVATRRR